MNGLDLFSGIGGIAEALAPWVRTVAYCENDRYAQAVLLSRMARGEIHTAPIWDDVTTLKGSDLPPIDIISGGFPCQDISIAGRGEGVEGERSGLFGEIIRLAGELRPSFLFLENVPAITFRGLDRVTAEISRLRYDCRWGVLSAFDVGAPHKRDRWWLLAYRKNEGIECGAGGGADHIQQGGGWNNNRERGDSDVGEGDKKPGVADTESKGGERGGSGERGEQAQRGEGVSGRSGAGGEDVADTESKRVEGSGLDRKQEPRLPAGKGLPRCNGSAGARFDWSTEPNVGRVVTRLPFRSNRLMCLGNSVVPQCAREAFKRLMGL